MNELEGKSALKKQLQQMYFHIVKLRWLPLDHECHQFVQTYWVLWFKWRIANYSLDSGFF